ncbi:glutamyl-tRNA amidotransferase [Mycolicibacterium sp. XJ870]
MTPAHQWRDKLRQELLSARKARDTARVAALRSALSAIDNAETPDAVESDTHAGGPIAGAGSGVGSTETARRVLSEAEIRNLIQAEIAESIAAATEYVAGGHHARAADLRAQADALAHTLRDV